MHGLGRAAGGAPSWPAGFAARDVDRAALHVLLGLSSMTPRRLLELALEYPSAGGCLAAVARGRSGSRADQETARAAKPEAAVACAAAARSRLVAVGDPEYPPRLLDLFDPPAGLFVRGRDLSAASSPVGIVGARNCSAPGREIAESLGRALAGAGACVVSGAARGIDAAAHRGALSAPRSPEAVPTVAVLGSGIDVAYPAQNRGLLGRILDCGTVVAEYPPGTPAEPFRFPARNRIIAGLSRAVVVVEGTAGSGSLITAEHALDLGREIMAVPGPVFSELAAAPLGLIRDGAVLIRGPADLLFDLGLAPEPSRSPTKVESAPQGLSPREAAVWKALAAPASIDVVARASELALPDAIATLVGLELRGLVAQAGGRYRRRAGLCG